MPLNPEHEAAVKRLVWSAMYPREQCVEVVCEEMFEPGEADPDDVAAFVDEEIQRKLEAERRWPKVTDCDRLAALFEDLNVAGLVALMNAGMTMSDGQSDCADVCEQRGGPGPDCQGYCFFHAQDLERAQEGGGLMLAFGHFSNEPTQWTSVAKQIVAAAKGHGLSASWNGDTNSRIELSPFVWQMRGFPSNE